MLIYDAKQGSQELKELRKNLYAWIWCHKIISETLEETERKN